MQSNGAADNRQRSNRSASTLNRQRNSGYTQLAIGGVRRQLNSSFAKVEGCGSRERTWNRSANALSPPAVCGRSGGAAIGSPIGPRGSPRIGIGARNQCEGTPPARPRDSRWGKARGGGRCHQHTSLCLTKGKRSTAGGTHPASVLVKGAAQRKCGGDQRSPPLGVAARRAARGHDRLRAAT